MKPSRATGRPARQPATKRPADFVTPPALVKALVEVIGPPKISRPRRIQALAELFELFNRRRSEIRGMRYIDVPRLRDAYLRYHLPMNAARSHYLLRHLVRFAPEVSELQEVVDLGCGPATSSLATRFALPGPRRYTLVDRSRSALQIGRRLLSACAGEPSAVESVSTRVAQLPTFPRLPSKALVWLSMVLNELCVGTHHGPDGETFLERLKRLFEPGSVVIIIEPALRAAGRQLLRLHDLVLESGAWEILAPCTHQGSCPLLRAKGDPWCHFHFSWEAPALVTDVARPLGLSWDTPAFSYLVLKRTDNPTLGSKKTGRVIGDPMDLRDGGRGAYVCQGAQRRTVPLGKEPVHRGDVVKIDGDHAQRVERW
jgi:ribosomal protein RSM22 (predicted rRNA methylase)